MRVATHRRHQIAWHSQDDALRYRVDVTFGRIAIAVCFALLLGVPLLFRPAPVGGGDATSSDATNGGAGQQAAGPLIIITPHNEQIRYEFARGFDRWHQRKFGQPAKVVFNVPGGTSEIRKMLESQYTAALEAGREPGGDADMVFGGGTFEHGRLKRGVRIGDKDEPVSQPVDFTEEWLRDTYGENTIGDVQLYDPDHHWFALALSGFGIVFNRDALDSLGIPEPNAWKDMCDPRLRGWVALVNPNQSGSVTTAFESILKREGWIRGWQILRRMAANGRSFSNSSLKPPMDVSVGDAAMGVSIDFLGRFQAQALREAGDEHRVGYVDPPGGSTIDPDPISMLRGAPHPELAKRFIEFCLSDEGQALWQFAASESNATAGGMGPLKYELRRLPVKRSMYEKYSDRMIDQVNPYVIATPVKYPDPNYRDLIAPMYAAMVMDNHHALREAWNAIVEHPAYPREAGNIVTADDVDDAELKAMLAAFDRLPVIAGAGRESLDLADEKALGAVRNGWVRNGFAKDGLWDAESTGLDALRKRMGAFFHEQYAEASSRQITGADR